VIANEIPVQEVKRHQPKLTKLRRSNLKVYIDGKFVPAEEGSVSVFDHGFLYGDGVFEGIAVYRSKAFRLAQHIARLFDSARAIGLEVPLTVEQLEAAIQETIRKNNIIHGYVRPIITRGRGALGLNPDHCPKPTVVLIPQRAEDYPIMQTRKPRRAITSSFRRNPPFSIPASAKTLNYLNNILAKQQANAAGVDEAIMLDWTDQISEGTGSNVFMVRGNRVYTPSLHGSVLPGITRMVILEICKEHGITVSESDFTLEALYSADEAFLTSTSLGIQPLVEVDGRKIGSGEEGPKTRRLRMYFDKLKKSESG
jgi:branched-chain amino acid aminotransferase